MIVTAIKKAEDSNLAVVRCFEAEGSDTKASMKLYDSKLEWTLPKNAIATRREDGQALNLMEWNEQE